MDITDHEFIDEDELTNQALNRIAWDAHERNAAVMGCLRVTWAMNDGIARVPIEVVVTNESGHELSNIALGWALANDDDIVSATVPPYHGGNDDPSFLPAVDAAIRALID